MPSLPPSRDPDAARPVACRKCGRPLAPAPHLAVAWCAPCRAWTLVKRLRPKEPNQRASPSDAKVCGEEFTPSRGAIVAGKSRVCESCRATSPPNATAGAAAVASVPRAGIRG